MQFDPLFVVVDQHFGFERKPGGDARPADRAADLEFCTGTVLRLALLQGDEAGQFFGVFLDQVGNPAKGRCALCIGGASPGRKGGPRRGNGGVDVDHRSQRHLGCYLAGGRVDDLERSASQRRFAVNRQCMDHARFPLKSRPVQCQYI